MRRSGSSGRRPFALPLALNDGLTQHLFRMGESEPKRTYLVVIDDSPEARVALRFAARRAINRILVYSTFYELRDYFAGRRWEPAVLLLRLADAAAPGHAGVCFGFAQAYAQLGREKEALDALDCAAKGKGATSATIEESALLEPIRASPRYREILNSLRP